MLPLQFPLGSIAFAVLSFIVMGAALTLQIVRCQRGGGDELDIVSGVPLNLSSIDLTNHGGPLGAILARVETVQPKYLS